MFVDSFAEARKTIWSGSHMIWRYGGVGSLPRSKETEQKKRMSKTNLDMMFNSDQNSDFNITHVRCNKRSGVSPVPRSSGTGWR